MTVVSF